MLRDGDVSSASLLTCLCWVWNSAAATQLLPVFHDYSCIYSVLWSLVNCTEVVTVPLAGSSSVCSNNLKETVLPSQLSITSLGLWAIQITNLSECPVHRLRCLLHILINNLSDFPQVFPPHLKCRTVHWGKWCKQPPRPEEAAMSTRPSQRRKGGGSTQGWFAYTDPTTSPSLLKGRGATRAEHQLLSAKTCRLLS